MGYPANIAIGDRYANPDGNTYIVVEIDQGCPIVLEDLDILDDPNGFAWDPVIWDEAAETGQLTPIDANPEMTRIITDRAAYEKTVAEIVGSIPAADHRSLFNTIAAVKHWGGKLAAAQDDVNKYSAHRAEELHKLVGIVGTQDKAAKILGINQSTLSRALRQRA